MLPFLCYDEYNCIYMNYRKIKRFCINVQIGELLLMLNIVVVLGAYCRWILCNWCMCIIMD